MRDFIGVPPLPDARAEAFLELLGDFVARELVVLSAALGNLDGAELRREPAGHVPVESRGEAVEQSRPVGVAAAGGIDHFRRLGARDLDFPSAGVDERSAAAL